MAFRTATKGFGLRSIAQEQHSWKRSACHRAEDRFRLLLLVEEKDRGKKKEKGLALLTSPFSHMSMMPENGLNARSSLPDNLGKFEREHAFLDSNRGKVVAQVGGYLAERVIQARREFLGVFDPPEQARNLHVLGDQLAVLHC